MGMDNSDLHQIPDKFLGQIIHNLQSFPNETVNFAEPQLRKSLANIYPLFLVLYSLLVVFGTVGNVAMIAYILRRRLYRDATCAFIMNIGVCNVIMSVLLLPLSLAILLIQNWIFGSFLCYFVPMLQDVPIHASMATMVFIAVDRYRMIVYPLKPRVPPFIAVLAVWVMSLCVVLPYAVYMNYIDLQVLFGRQFKGVGICTVNLGDDIAEYTRGLFVVLYAFPLALILFLHVRVSGEMRSREVPVNMVALDSRSRESQQDIWSVQDTRPPSSIYLNDVDGRDGFLSHEAHQLPSFMSPTPTLMGGGGSQTPTMLHPMEEAELDLAREKRNQRYIATIVTAFALCLCPLMILRLVKNMVMETYDNSGHFDITFITFVWIAFLPTVTTPALFGAWKISRTTKERLQGYLNLGSRGRRSNHAQNFTPIFYSCHARAAHRLSLDHALVPTSPHTHSAAHSNMQGVHTPVFSRSEHHPRPHSLPLHT
ncbi:orexin receptor type 1-like [Penaeus monodon]|uniref:orexin receptor type 1-like n=1 Tax=Penaeus monodon TaxID=6687 RepID=UPI0018A753C0|nr:orexin receptor type 1-like [Penaeus monodon]